MTAFTMNSLRSILVGFVCVYAVPQMRTRARQETTPHSARSSAKLLRVVSADGTTLPHQRNGGLDETNGSSTNSEQEFETDTKVFDKSFAGHSSESKSQANQVSEQSQGKEAMRRPGNKKEKKMGKKVWLEKAFIGTELCSTCNQE